MNTMQWMFLMALFLAVAALTYALAALVWRPHNASARLAAVAGRAEGVRWPSQLVRLATPLARLAMPANDGTGSAFRRRFFHAGWRHPSVPLIYFAAKVVLAVVCPLLLGLALGLRPGGLPGTAQATLLSLLLAAAAGYGLPNAVLAWRIARYQRELLEAFPDAVDLIIVCIEAGLGLDAAIARTAQEMRLRSPALADELQLVGLELRVGVSREQALRNLALRAGLDDLGALVSMLVQADRFGISIAESLRVHAEGMRTRRQQRAEEAAARLPLKLLFPLIFCIFPALMLVLLGPAVINVFRMLVKS